jgi:hypothetical protein
MKRVRLLLTATVVCLSVVSAAWYARWQIVTSKPSLSYRVAPEFSEHQPVVVEIILDNPRDLPLAASLGRDQLGSFHFTLRPPDGTSIRVEPGAPRGAGGLTRRGDLTVAARTRHVDRVLLNEWLTFDQVGDFTLHIAFDGSLRDRDRDVPVDREVDLTIRVVPRNEALLVDTAAHLLNVIKVNASADASIAAANELSYLTDPIAVHYLVRLIEVNRGFEYEAIEGLERIGGDEARRALEGLLASRRYYVPDWARGALDRLNARRR